MYTVECRYNVVQFITILPSALWWQQQNVNQTPNSRQQTPHTSPSRASYGVSIVRILEKIDRLITAPHCTFMSPKYSVRERLKYNPVVQSIPIVARYKRSHITAVSHVCMPMYAGVSVCTLYIQLHNVHYTSWYGSVRCKLSTDATSKSSSCDSVMGEPLASNV